MVIDQDHDTRVLTRQILEEQGHFVISTTSVAGAFSLLEQSSAPSIIFAASDRLVPLNQLVETLKQNPKIRSVPIIQIVTEGELLAPGLSVSLLKPVRRSDLLELLERT